MENCYNTGRVQGSRTSGVYGGLSSMGLSSNSTGKICNSYNIGNIDNGHAGYSNTSNIVGGIVASDGVSWRGPAIIDNCYCGPQTSYSYCKWTGSSYSLQTVGRVSNVENIKTYAETLGSANWVDDVYNINNGYPILRWQVEAAQLNARHEYMHVGDTKQLVLDTSGLPFENESLTWHSYDESIVSVDSNGLLTAVGEGYTTIWVEYSQYNIKVMAIINVTKKGAIAVPQITGGTNNNCSFLAVLKEDGTVWTSGANNYGQLGNGTYNDSNELVQVMIDNKTALKNVIKISSSRYHTVALTRDGHVFTWGRNHGGQLGTGDQNNRNLATCVLRKR